MMRNSACARNRNTSIHIGGLALVDKWLTNLLSIGIPLAGTLYSLSYFWHHRVTWAEVSAFFVFYALVGIPVGMGMHRYFSHRSFKAHPLLKLWLGVFGSMAFEGPIIRWIADHRRHHHLTDEMGDVHSPYVTALGENLDSHGGLFYAHFAWMFDRVTTNYATYAPDALEDKTILFLHKTYWLWCACSLALPWLYGYLIGGPDAAFGSMLLGGCVRTTVFHHVTWSVNSVGHSVGTQPFDTNDESRNNLFLTILTFGEGWHNNHHAFPVSAIQGFSKWEFDPNGMLLRLFERVGLARDVIVPNPTVIEKKRKRTKY